MPGIKIIQFLACFITLFTSNCVLYNTAAQPHYWGFKSCGMSCTVLHCKTNSSCTAWHCKWKCTWPSRAPLTQQHNVTPKKTWILSSITVRVSSLTDMFVLATDPTVFQQIPLHCALSSQQWSWTRAVGWRYNLRAQEAWRWLVQGHTATYRPHRAVPSKFCGGLLRFPTLHDGVLHLTQQQAKCVEGLWKLGKVMHWVYKWMNKCLYR